MRLLAPTAESAGTRIATELVAACRSRDREERLAWFEWLTEALAPEREPLAGAARAYLRASTPMNADRLTQASEPARQMLLRRLNTAPGGTALLIELRCDLLAMLGRHRHLAPLENDLSHLLASWFNRGFLSLRQIDWASPATLLERLIAYEAVHEMQGWGDLRRRLEDDRRCYGFFHPSMPDDPVIFVEAALTRRLPDTIAEILHAPVDPARARSADTAIFYSINNCQPGLRGIGFGNLLIKQIIADLQAECPSIRRFATLSPVPTFRSRWVGSHHELQKSEIAASCAQYLLTNRFASKNSPIDPVAHFHLSNGARLGRILTDADPSDAGRRQSYGMMVNYIYDPDSIEANAFAYHCDGTVPHDLNISW